MRLLGLLGKMEQDSLNEEMKSSRDCYNGNSKCWSFLSSGTSFACFRNVDN